MIKQYFVGNFIGRMLFAVRDTFEILYKALLLPKVVGEAANN